MLIERILKTADALVVLNLDTAFLLWIELAPMTPGAHESVLQNWKLIGLITGIVQNPLYQARRNGVETCRTFYCILALFASEAWDQILAIVQGFRKVAEFGAIAQII